jgi:uncharacterized membrane protein YgcG
MMRIFAGFTVTIWLLCMCAFGQRAESAVTPSKPERYFNDFASLVSPKVAERLNEQLAEFDRLTSNQILVVIYPSLPAGAVMEDFAEDAFRAWKPGQQGKNNGAILFLFVNDRRARIQTGYGLEKALPDAVCKRIISDELAPSFQQGDFNGGLTAAVRAMIGAIGFEYPVSEYKAKSEFRQGDLSYDVTGEAITSSIGGDQSGIKAEEGARFVIIYLTIRNESDATRTVSANDFKLRDAKGRLFSVSTDAIKFVERDIVFRQLQPGITKKAATVFEVPADSLTEQLIFVIPRDSGTGSPAVRVNLGILGTEERH